MSTGPLQLTPLIESHDEQGYAISGCLKLAQSEKQESLCFLRPVEENHRSLNVAIESLSLTRIFSLVHLEGLKHKPHAQGIFSGICHV